MLSPPRRTGTPLAWPRHAATTYQNRVLLGGGAWPLKPLPCVYRLRRLRLRQAVSAVATSRQQQLNVATAAAGTEAATVTAVAAIVARTKVGRKKQMRGLAEWLLLTSVAELMAAGDDITQVGDGGGLSPADGPSYGKCP